jgi:hypothetical protein
MSNKRKISKGNENSGVFHNVNGQILEVNGRIIDAKDEYETAMANDPKDEYVENYERTKDKSKT